jgi:hypothetical protein
MRLVCLLFVCSVVFIGCNKPGCTDPLAVNYDSSANDEDGTCQYVPTLSTIPLNISTNNVYSVQTGGVISSDGGSDVTLRGLCWGTSPNPTIANDTTINGSGTGTFSSTVISLQLLTTYYFRAYATNSNGTGYGDEFSLTTSLEIGISFQGGTIFYVDGNGGGLIAGPDVGGAYADWGCAGIDIIGADGITIGTGHQNTLDISSSCPSSDIAVWIEYLNNASSNINGGYNDWYIPSKDELYELVHNNGISDLHPAWSSTEFNSDSAWLQVAMIHGGAVGVMGKNYHCRLYSIRTF